MYAVQEAHSLVEETNKCANNCNKTKWVVSEVYTRSYNSR